MSSVVGPKDWQVPRDTGREIKFHAHDIGMSQNIGLRIEKIGAKTEQRCKERIER
jgi:hypothetical protein